MGMAEEGVIKAVGQYHKGSESWKFSAWSRNDGAPHVAQTRIKQMMKFKVRTGSEFFMEPCENPWTSPF